MVPGVSPACLLMVQPGEKVLSLKLNLVIAKTSGCILTKSQARYLSVLHTIYFCSLLLFFRKVPWLFSGICGPDRRCQTFTGRQSHNNPLIEPFLAEWKGEGGSVYTVSWSEGSRLYKLPEQCSRAPILTNGNSINCPNADRMNLIKLGLLFFF